MCLKSKVSFNIFETNDIAHNEDLSISDLRTIIIKLEEDNSLNIKLRILNEIQSYLEKMKPVKCDKNFYPFLSLLLTSIKSIPNRQIRLKLYTNIYVHLCYVFFEDKTFLMNYDKNNEIIDYIHSISNNKVRHKYYFLYTSNYQTFAYQRSKNLIKIYNFYFCNYLNTSKQFMLFSNEFTKIGIVLYGKLKEMNNSKTKNKGEK